MALSDAAVASSAPLRPATPPDAMVARQPAARLAAGGQILSRNPLVLGGAVVVLVWVVVSVAAPLVAPYGPLAQKVVDRLQAPGPAHLFGTDALGRDILSRVLYGGRISLPVGFLVVSVSLVIG